MEEDDDQARRTRRPQDCFSYRKGKQDVVWCGNGKHGQGLVRISSGTLIAAGMGSVSVPYPAGSCHLPEKSDWKGHSRCVGGIVSALITLFSQVTNEESEGCFMSVIMIVPCPECRSDMEDVKKFSLHKCASCGCVFRVVADNRSADNQGSLIYEVVRNNSRVLRFS